MPDHDPNTTASRGRLLVFGALGIAVGALLVVWLQPDDEQAPLPAPANGAGSPPPAGSTPASAEPVPVTAGPADFTIASGQSIPVRIEEIPAGRPLVLALDLEVPSADGAPRPVRLIAEDGRTLETEGALQDETRTSARVAIPAGWLRPGRVIIEVRTTERSHFPLRRYALEVE